MVMGLCDAMAMAIDERDMVVSKQDKGKRNEGTNVTYMYTHSSIPAYLTFYPFPLYLRLIVINLEPLVAKMAFS